MEKENNILITGGLGFISSNFVRRARHLKKNYKIFTIDRGATSLSLNNSYHIINNYFTDLSDFNTVENIFKINSPDIIIHAAEDCSLDKNILIMDNLIKLSKKYNVKKFIYLSSTEVYPSETVEYKFYDNEKKETDAPKPSNRWSIGKLTNELLLESSGLNYLTLRLSSNYGSRQQVGLIPNTLKSILNNNPIILENKGENQKNWIYVSDTCEAIFHCIDKDLSNSVINVSGVQVSDIDIVQKVCNIAEKGWDLISLKEGNPTIYNSSNKKLKETGYSLQYNFPSSIEETVVWYLNNQWILKG